MSQPTPVKLAISSPAAAAEAALEEALAEVRDGDESLGPVTGVYVAVVRGPLDSSQHSHHVWTHGSDLGTPGRVYLLNQALYLELRGGLE